MATTSVLSIPQPLQHFHSRMAQDVARVSRRCIEAKESGELDLHDCKLVSMPDAVFVILRPHLDTVTVMNMSANLLRTFNARLFGFNALREPHLHSNLFSELPAAVAALERLEVLDLSDCQFLHVPAQALQLPALATLRCNGNKIARVDIAQLHASPSLRHVELQRNPIDDHTRTQIQARPAKPVTILL